MKTLEEVKEHFKNAKEVRCLSDSKTINLDLMTDKGIHKYSNRIWFDYLTDDGLNSCMLYDGTALAEIISYKDEYPKVMLVWDYDETLAVERVIHSKYNDFYICLTGISNLKELNKAIGVVYCKHAKDLPTVKEVTLEEVAEKFNVSVENLRIKE